MEGVGARQELGHQFTWNLEGALGIALGHDQSGVLSNHARLKVLHSHQIPF
jgi:hypothetical protein